jgi:hypothetical protein
MIFWRPEVTLLGTAVLLRTPPIDNIGLRE